MIEQVINELDSLTREELYELVLELYADYKAEKKINEILEKELLIADYEITRGYDE